MYLKDIYSYIDDGIKLLILKPYTQWILNNVLSCTHVDIEPISRHNLSKSLYRGKSSANTRMDPMFNTYYGA